MKSPRALQIGSAFPFGIKKSRKKKSAQSHGTQRGHWQHVNGLVVILSELQGHQCDSTLSIQALIVFYFFLCLIEGRGRIFAQRILKGRERERERERERRKFTLLHQWRLGFSFDPGKLNSFTAIVFSLILLLLKNPNSKPPEAELCPFLLLNFEELWWARQRNRRLTLIRCRQVIENIQVFFLAIRCFLEFQFQFNLLVRGSWRLLM